MFKKNGTIFDTVAQKYDQFRPSPPKEVLNFVSDLLKNKNNILEIGAGTGQLTIPLLHQKHAITALEPGLEMSKILLEKTQSFKANLKVSNDKFEHFENFGKYDALISCQAFHWIEAKIGIELASKHLNSGNIFILIWNADNYFDTPYYHKSKSIYNEYMTKKPFPAKGGLKDFPQIYSKEIENSGNFQKVHQKQIDWSRHWNTSDYLNLLSTFSDHIALPDEFYTKIGKVIDEMGGTIEKHYTSHIIWAVRK